MIWKVCFTVALILCAAALAAVILSWKPGHASPKVRLWIAMAGAFAVTFTLLLPYFWAQKLPAMNRIIMDLHATAQAFTLDIPIGEILKEITPSHPVHGCAVAVSSVLCPLFTVGFLLSLVRNVWSVLRLAFSFGRHAYVFSELNEMSLAFAQGVVKEKKGLAVFAGVTVDTDPALTAQAERLRAICFSGSVANLPIRRHSKRGVHFLLMEEDESSALSASLALTKRYRKRENTQVVLYSSSETAGNVIDSVENVSPSLGSKLTKDIKDNFDIIWDAKTWTKNSALERTDGFYLRRVDPIRDLARNTLLDKDLILHLKEQSAASKTISLMIVGGGHLGRDLMKTAVWLYQVVDYKVEINLFDKRSEAEVLDQLKLECPELFDEKRGNGAGDANYEINVFCGADCFSASFDKRLSPQALQRTQAVFVSLGDDDQNVRAAIRLRELFDRAHGKCTEEGKEALPWIYAVVYNDAKLECLESQEPAAENGEKTQTEKHSRLQNHKEENYEIRLIGSLSSRFCPHALETCEKTEREALARHFSWMVANHFVNEAFQNDGEFRQQLASRYLARGIKVPRSIYDPFAACFENPAGKPKPIEDFISAEVRKYYAYEYYRDSSIAAHLHRNIFLQTFNGTKPEDGEARKKRLTSFDKDVCKSRLNEHIRWNAYMRSIGFRHGDERFDRGRMHNDLVPFDELVPAEQFKD